MEKEYIELREPDLKRLAQMVMAAKGSKRSMAQFAEACGISPSTMSRIANEKITRPISLDNLKAIYLNRAEECSYEFRDFARSNGMIAKDEYEKMTDRDKRHERMREMELRRRNMQSILTTALTDRGISVKVKGRSLMLRSARDIQKKCYGMSLYPDVEMELESEWHDTYNQEPEWGGKLNLYLFSRMWEDDDQSGMRDYTERTIMDRAAKVFLIDSWDEEFFVDTWTAFVFCDRDLFEIFVENVRCAPIKSNMSAILVDTHNMDFLKEVWISASDKVSSPFDEPIYNSQEWLNRYYEILKGIKDDEE